MIETGREDSPRVYLDLPDEANGRLRLGPWRRPDNRGSPNRITGCQARILIAKIANHR